MAGKTLVKDMTGKRFGCLTVIERNGICPRRKLALWRCRCDCGGEAVATGTLLRLGKITSCGCHSHRYHKRKRHGMAETLLYASWMAMHDRCRNPNNPGWERYGGRGITVCERWGDFGNFFADMGEKPSREHTIERIDNNGNYEPGNCRWATRKEQANNTARNHVLNTSRGQIRLCEAATIAGVTMAAIERRLRRGWTDEEIIQPKNFQRTAARGKSTTC